MGCTVQQDRRSAAPCPGSPRQRRRRRRAWSQSMRKGEREPAGLLAPCDRVGQVCDRLVQQAIIALLDPEVHLNQPGGWPPVRPTETYVVIADVGTTGRRKLVPHPRRMFWAGAASPMPSHTAPCCSCDPWCGTLPARFRMGSSAGSPAPAGPSRKLTVSPHR